MSSYFSAMVEDIQDFNSGKGGMMRGGSGEFSAYLFALCDRINRPLHSYFTAKVLPCLQAGTIPSIVADELRYVETVSIVFPRL